MPISLSHLAEVLIAEMAERSRRETLDALGLTDFADLDHIRSIKRFAHHECRLAPHHKYMFDGASRVDVVLWIQKNLAVALELKLGKMQAQKVELSA